MKKLAALAATVLVLAACGGGPATAPGSAPAAASASAAATAAPKPVTVRFGQVGGISDGGIYLADAKGFFKAQGITLESVPFQSAANMIAPLGTGELQAGGGAPSAGLYNAIDRGIQMRIVADKGSLLPGHGYEAIVVRKALADKVKSAKDMKGLRIAIAARDIVPEYSLDQFLRTGGLTIKDVEVVTLAFPDMLPAIANGSVDVAAPTEPTATRILDAGTAVLVTRTDVVVPGEQTAVVLFAEKFAQDKDAATRFMTAYLQGVRLYNDAFDKKDPAKRADAVQILAQATKLDAALIDRLVMPGLHPDGKVNVESLNASQQYFVAKGSQTKAVDMAKVVDPSFADAAAKQLGVYR